mgnify:CR=1 FL=1
MDGKEMDFEWFMATDRDSPISSDSSKWLADEKEGLEKPPLSACFIHFIAYFSTVLHHGQ